MPGRPSRTGPPNAMRASVRLNDLTCGADCRPDDVPCCLVATVGRNACGYHMATRSTVMQAKRPATVDAIACLTARGPHKLHFIWATASLCRLLVSASL